MSRARKRKAAKSEIAKEGLSILVASSQVMVRMWRLQDLSKRLSEETQAFLRAWEALELEILRTEASRKAKKKRPGKGEGE